jgi:hypothetical protein
MEVPFPRAASKRLMSFFTFQISMFFSASLAWASLILAVNDASRSRSLRGLHELDAAGPSVKIDLFSVVGLRVTWEKRSRLLRVENACGGSGGRRFYCVGPSVVVPRGNRTIQHGGKEIFITPLCEDIHLPN